ncbi:hypothetical protein [Novosphingobium sp. CCH12-A3]|uniref:hypothetical protein n=1 Tax=Novosphingobium sp. CCH12-A3 TaxID=1768752 RepID=UPI000AAB4462|nr:hypothetical protein [Novosphingobium sp. CCH12-A3]
MTELVNFRVVNQEDGTLLGISSCDHPLEVGASFKMKGTDVEYTIRSISIDPDPMEFPIILKV